MLPKDTSMASLLAALTLAFMLGNAGYRAHDVMADKAKTQAGAVSDFQDWKRQYLQLLPLEERWTKALRPITDAKDLYTLHGMLGDTPSSNPDTLLVDRIERLTLNERDLGAQRVCLSSNGGSGVLFTEKDFPTLLAGLDTLARRSDVQMGAVTLSQDKAQAKAWVTPLCLLLRDEEGSKK